MSIAPVRTKPMTRRERAFMGLTMLAAGQLIWAFVMGIAAGGQFHEEEWPDWDAIAPWPVLPIPAWLTIAIGVGAACAGVLMAMQRRDYEELPVLFQAVALTVVVLIALPFFLAGMYSRDDVMQLHWIAALPQPITLIALVTRIIITARQHKRGTAA